MNTSIEIESSKRLRSVVPSRMRREIDIHVSCDEVLKVKPKTIIYTRVQGGNEENFDSSYGAAPTQDEVAFSAHATIRDEIPVAGGAYKLIDENGEKLRDVIQRQRKQTPAKKNLTAATSSRRRDLKEFQPSGVVSNKVDSGERLSSVDSGVAAVSGKGLSSVDS
nr:uncharacterized protein LOC109175453 [Ipomoea batatas]